jgi:hypothetical protein
MKKEIVSYIRLQNQILNADGTLLEKFPSISQAKRRSRLLQKGGNRVTVDHSEDPKPVVLDFGKRFKHQYISRAEERRVTAEQARKVEKDSARARQQLGLSPAYAKRPQYS